MRQNLKSIASKKFEINRAYTILNYRKMKKKMGIFVEWGGNGMCIPSYLFINPKNRIQFNALYLISIQYDHETFNNN